MKTAIVIGATGLVGKSLISLLTENQHIERIIAVTRRPVSYSSTKVENQVVDFGDLQSYASVFSGDMLFSCLGTTLKQAGSYQAQRTVDVDYQYQIAQLAAHNGVSHYLLVSSSGANAKSKSPYFQMKGELEDKIKRLNFSRISIFQPSLLLGERDHFRLGEKFGALLLPLLCKLPILRQYRPITGEQVAHKLLRESLNQTNKLSTYTLSAMFE